MKDLGLLWAVPAYVPYIQSKLTSDTVREAQQQLGVALPDAYLALLQIQNGGYLRATWPDSPHRRLDGIGPDFPSITADTAWWRAPDAEDEMWVPPSAGRLIPFDGEGHWNLCWDYRDAGPRGEPSIRYIDIESEEDTAVAPSFGAFLDGLVDRVEATGFRIAADIDMDAFGRLLAEATGLQAQDQGDWDLGYRQLRVRLGDTRWMWISPNEVPAGFHRHGDRTVATRRTALRLPADPACRLIVTCTPDARDITAKALRATGLWHG